MIKFDKETRIFYIETKNLTYAIKINGFDYPEHLYFGNSIGHDDISFINTVGGATSMFAIAPDSKAGYMSTPSECTFYGTSDYREPTYLLKNEDGSVASDLKYTGYDIINKKPPISGMPCTRGTETLIIHLKESNTDFGVDLYYSPLTQADTIARRIVYINRSDSVKKLNRAYSFAMRLKEHDFDMISLYGAWSSECKVERTPIHHGVVSIDSKRGMSSAALNPFMALAKHNATEFSGDVFGVSLMYSGSFVLKAEGIISGDTLILGGANDFNFSWKLNPGEQFETPEVLITYSDKGVGGMSRNLHDAYREYVINEKTVRTARPIVINNWEATHFDFTEDQIKAFVDSATELNVDTFVLDDGWFGERNSENSGLGDWKVNTEKLPGGLNGLSEYVHDRGMKFGLWIEPEMINEDSELYREHPEYAIHIPGRALCRARKQFVLDLTKSEVRDRIVDDINKIIDENKIEYVKWDCNRNLTEFYSEGLDAERQGEFTHRYCLGFYDMCQRIVKAHPDVFFEGCSSGGARFDGGMLYYFPQIWTSDNTDAVDRTVIQYGTSMAYPISSHSCHVSAVPKYNRYTSLKTRGDIAALGATGYEFDPCLLDEEEKAEIRAQVEEYKVRNEKLVLDGDLYRLDDPNTSNFFTYFIVSKDKNKAILVSLRKLGSKGNEIKRAYVRGLADDKKYFVPELGESFMGKTLNNIGIPLKFADGDFNTVEIHFEKTE